jgi:hypothetical protein
VEGDVQPLDQDRRRAATSAEAALRFAQPLARACAGALANTVAGVILHGSVGGCDAMRTLSLVS